MEWLVLVVILLAALALFWRQSQDEARLRSLLEVPKPPSKLRERDLWRIA